MPLNKHTLHLIGATASGVLLSLAVAVPAQQAPRPAPPKPLPSPSPTSGAPFGGPLAGLTALQMAAFEDGFDEFTNVETPEGGKLGPIFNGNSCSECHTTTCASGALAGRRKSPISPPLQAMRTATKWA